MFFKAKLLIVAAGLFMGSAGIAYAATGGDVSGALSGGLAALAGSSDSDSTDSGTDDDQGGGHGNDVSTVARDPEATGTKTLPNGREIENHGMAVSEQARLHDDDSYDDDDDYDDYDDDYHVPPSPPPAPVPDDDDDDYHSVPSGGSGHDNSDDDDNMQSSTNHRSR